MSKVGIKAKRLHRLVRGIVLMLAVQLLPATAQGAAKVTFNRDIRPILSDKCFFCHGFDPKNRKADLRLDDRDTAVQMKAIVPGKPDESEVLKRMLSHDEDEMMPPPKSKLPRVTDQEVATLRQWIAEGAEYEAHWAFVPVKPVQAGTSIDSIIEQGLAERGLKLQAQASANTLARRLSFDLTGLPPTPEQIAAAGKDLPGYIESLLASPRYGERMAVDWLEVARYADSYGFQVDRDREVWPWRDWVIQAFNDNLPYDQFVTWQIAGDMLPHPTHQQRLATAFSRLHQQESEGGSVEEEYRVEYVADRVQTFATAFLGLTFECSRCHDHKFDPISQRDYYGLFAMFQNIDEAGLYSYLTTSAPTPSLALMDAEAEKKLRAAQSEVEALERSLRSEPKPKLSEEDFGKAKAVYSFDTLENGGKLPGQGKLTDLAVLGAATPQAPPRKSKENKGEEPPKPSLAATLRGENKLTAGHAGQAVLFTGDDPVDLPVGNFNRHDPFSVSLWLKTPDRKDRAVVFHRSRAWTDAASRGYELLIEDGRLKWSLIHFWPGDAISVRSRTEVPLNEWTHVVVTNDGSSRARGLRIYINGQLADTEVVKDHLTRNIIGGGGETIALGERFRDRGFKGGMVDDFRVYDADISAPLEAQLADSLHRARAEVTQLMSNSREIMTMMELPAPKKAYILFRGEYDKRTDEVTAQTPAALGLLPDDVPKNRLSLARWLTDKKHPLFARVTVNRLWQSLFGRGLVKTAEDFGSQGERPMYPELMDYLAAKFMSNGWDVKALLKEIVSSKVYQQSSVAEAKTMEDDPENQWLARGPRFRLSAEMIRDNALSAAGLLKHSLGGPPVNAYEMTEAFKPVAANEPYRRSVYSNWRRTSPPPAMQAFDAPKRSVCTAKRERTDTPLQALVLMNGVQYVEAARVLAEQAQKSATGDLPAVINYMFLQCLSRTPTAAERAICEQLFQEQLTFYQASPELAAQLLKHGNASANSEIPPAQAAASTILAQALLCHDECVVKR